MNRSATLLLAILIASISVGIVGAVTVDSGVEIQGQSGGGYLKFGSAVTPTVVEIADNKVDLTAPTDAYSTLRVGLPAGVNVTIITLGTYDLSFTTAQSGAKVTTFYLPRGQPTHITGATYTWSQPNYTASVTTSGASSVTLSWAELPSNKVNEGNTVLLQVFPLIMIFSIASLIKYPAYWREILGFMLVVAVAGFFSWMFYGWGF